MSPLTLYLARFFGLAMLLTCASLAIRPKAAIAAVTSVAESPGLMLVTGVFTLAAGVAAVIGHNVWSGGALPIVVTMIAWVTLLKGLALIAVPPSAMIAAYRVLHYPQRLGLVMGVAAVASAALTWFAFTAA